MLVFITREFGRPVCSLGCLQENKLSFGFETVLTTDDCTLEAEVYFKLEVGMS